MIVQSYLSRVMNIKKKNIEYLTEKFPKLGREKVHLRTASIEWPVSNKARVCEVMVNYKCNYKCSFCYNPPNFSDYKGKEPSFESVCESLYKGRKMGCWLATLIGGEPTLRKDIGKIASFARKIGYPCIKVCSNGSMMAQKDYVRYLADSGVNMFDVSLHGATASIHDKLVGTKGAFKKAVKAMENIKAVGKELGTNQVINKLNYKTFPEFFKMALMDFGINYFNIIYGHYRGSMAANERLLRVNISKTIPYLKDGLKIYKTKKIPVFARTLVNFTPCLIPSYYKIIADWESDTTIGEPLFIPNEKKINMADMKNAQSLKPGSCEKCVFNSRCRGFDREYFEIFGDAEFKPLKKMPKSEKLMVSFE